ncbi:C6 zinc finger domain protein [Penicillium odoratum]|uniref:C6 zinc finger domain protein n=1 Tax=Penicillium odoratum TaxID=1167516 RepID=UPI0025499CC2|nr:C6 zinc finger domain protein [Penicillium odoratum]KAJ5777431.1 C6 zinc finger domain protein [Penicillium odoratum]
MHQSKTRSKNGCRSCRIRKIKCDEEKQLVPGREEPQCKRCVSAGIVCEWKGGPIPRKSITLDTLSKGREAPYPEKAGGASQIARKRTPRNSQPRSSSYKPPLLPLPRFDDGHSDLHVTAANSLTLSGFDRECLSYLSNSTLVVLLGKHWPWSTLAYTYQKISVKEPMVMSMILATTAREVHRSRLYDQEALPSISANNESCELVGRVHYGRALSSLRHALKQDVKSPQKIEAIFVTLWLMIDYENRFGSGAPAINIHIGGIETLLHNHIVPLLQDRESGQSDWSERKTITFEHETPPQQSSPEAQLNTDSPVTDANSPDLCSTPNSLETLRCTSVPLFLLWTLYFFTPAALFFGPGTAKLDTDIFQFFLGAETPSTGLLTLSELYRISRQSPARFWGETYPVSAQLDDMENLPGLTLYHRSHIIQFKITELFKRGPQTEEAIGVVSPAQSCDSVENGRRVIETIYWASITFYSTMIYYHLCFPDILNNISGTQINLNLMSLSAAVSHVLELSLKLHRSRPRILVRITWPLFIAGIATSDQIYQDWVSIRLRELGRYGQNYDRISRRFDEIIQGGQPYSYERQGHFLSC